MGDKLTEEQLLEAKEAFGMIDLNSTGKIACKDLGTVVRSLGQNPSEADIAQMIREADTAKSGQIAYKDFLTVLKKHWCPVNPLEDIVDAFKMFDREGSGYITAVELKHVLVNLGEKMTGEEVDEMLKHASLDEDGQLNYTQFTQMLLSSIN